VNPQCGEARSSARHSNGFSKNKRLLNAQHYTTVFDAPDARASHRHLLILARYNHEPCHRLGLIIAKKNVRLAVQRNRIKRVIRENFRQLDNSEQARVLHAPPTEDSNNPCLDMIVMARRGIAELDNAEVSSILQQQWNKLFRQVTADTLPK